MPRQLPPLKPVSSGALNFVHCLEQFRSLPTKVHCLGNFLSTNTGVHSTKQHSNEQISIKTVILYVLQMPCQLRAKDQCCNSFGFLDFEEVYPNIYGLMTTIHIASKLYLILSREAASSFMFSIPCLHSHVGSFWLSWHCRRHSFLSFEAWQNWISNSGWGCRLVFWGILDYHGRSDHHYFDSHFVRRGTRRNMSGMHGVAANKFSRVVCFVSTVRLHCAALPLNIKESQLRIKAQAQIKRSFLTPWIFTLHLI